MLYYIIMSTLNNAVTSSFVDTSSVKSNKLIGRVKWFNNKGGFGFITTDTTDIFVHHSAINVVNQQYKYLVQGEYVEFEKTTTENSSHDCQASNVCGINSGKLMCETRNEFKVARSNYKNICPESTAAPTSRQSTTHRQQLPRQPSESSHPSRQQSNFTSRGSGPRATKDSNGEPWTLKTSKKPPQNRQSSLESSSLSS